MEISKYSVVLGGYLGGTIGVLGGYDWGTCLAQLCEFHDDPNRRIGADPDQLDDVRMIELLHDVCRQEREHRSRPDTVKLAKPH